MTENIVLLETKESGQLLAFWVNELSQALGKIQWEMVDKNCAHCRKISEFANQVRLEKFRAFEEVKEWKKNT